MAYNVPRHFYIHNLNSPQSFSRLIRHSKYRNKFKGLSNLTSVHTCANDLHHSVSSLRNPEVLNENPEMLSASKILRVFLTELIVVLVTGFSPLEVIYYCHTQLSLYITLPTSVSYLSINVPSGCSFQHP